MKFLAEKTFHFVLLSALYFDQNHKNNLLK